MLTRTRFATRDPEAARAMVAEVYADNHLRVSGNTQNFYFAQSRLDMGSVAFDQYHNTVTTEYVLEPFASVIIARVLDNTIDARTATSERRLGPGDIYLPARPDEGNFTRLNSSRVELTSIAVPLIERTDPEFAAARLRRLSYQPLSPAQGAAWQRTVRYVAGLADHSAAEIPTLVLGAAERLLAATLLSCFAPDQDVGPPQARIDATPITVRRALAFIESNLDADIGVADIARASYVGVRALQLAFRRHLDTTPLAYLRRARLDQVRDDLLRADPSAGDTVTGLAARWGFIHPSSFSAQYRAAFGELPSRTLHN